VRRRQLLRLVGVGAVGGLAGCSAGYQGASEPEEARTVAGPGDVTLPVDGSEMRTMVPPDHIAAITEPAFADDWSDLDIPEGAELPGLVDETAVIGVERDGRARAYPLAVLDWHEVVNDSFGGPLLVTYCPLCGSAVVAERTVAGSATLFGVSGKLYRGDLVMYDAATESLWSQLLATAIQGPRTGDRLSILPSRLTSWGSWREAHPDTEVLLPPPHSNTVRGRDATAPYFNSKYNYEEQNQLIGYDSEHGDLTPRTLVVGISHGGVARAYPYPTVRDEGVINDRISGLAVVVTVTPDGGLAAYDRRVQGTVRTFAAADGAHLTAAETRFERTTGEAVAGQLAGTTLRPATDVPPLFWSGWESFHPDTEVYGRA
jgi:hypothetical protein